MMKPALKAALISALVFPGLGHFYLKRGARGCLFLLPALVCLMIIAMRVLERASALLEQLPLNTLDPQALADQLETAIQAAMPTAALVVGIVCWGASIIDSFLLER